MARKRAATARSLSTAGGGLDKELLGQIALAVRVARVGRGLSQRELAIIVRRSQNLIFTVEAGKKDPGVILLARIADALALPLDFFLIPIQQPRSDSSATNQRQFEEGRDLLISLMKAMSSTSLRKNEGKRPKRQSRQSSD